MVDDYIKMIGRFFDIRLKGSTARAGCAVLIVLGIMKMFSGDFMNGGAIWALGATLWGIRDAQDSNHKE